MQFIYDSLKALVGGISTTHKLLPLNKITINSKIDNFLPLDCVCITNGYEYENDVRTCLYRFYLEMYLNEGDVVVIL
jgi:hypothetical protein